MTTAAIYARVSSERQKEEHTIRSQVAALIAYATERAWTVPAEWVFEDEGYSGASLVRPGLERLRDLASEGLIEKVLVYSPDRLSRKYAYQVLLIEELARHGVDIEFIKSPKAETPEDQLLLQFQGMIAEYERAGCANRARPDLRGTWVGDYPGLPDRKLRRTASSENKRGWRRTTASNAKSWSPISASAV